MTSFGWLHLTDLHLGMRQQRGLLPAVQDKFFEDLKRLYKKTQPWDLVIFTGDLTFQGSADEFKQVDEFLNRLWALFHELGTNPSLAAVPGNHDLTRPDLDKNSTARLLGKFWDTDENEDIRKQFWADPKCQYREAITTAFDNYWRWWENTQLKLPSQPGELPGDFSAVHRKDGATLGIVGLNTTFLQLAPGDYRGKLTVDPIQFQKVCDGDGPAWIKEQNACLLLTHQPPDWLNKTAKKQLESDISSYFDAHLFGHMHESRYEPHSTGGGPESRPFQANSLFGMDHFEDSSKKLRRHGYAIGRIELDGEKGRLIVWPRQGKRVADVWNFIADGDDIVLEDEHTRPRDFTLKKALSAPTTSTSVSVVVSESITVDEQTPAKRWAFLVGVNEYTHFSKLQYCCKDAFDLARAFREKLGFHQVYEFRDDAENPEFRPTRDCILQKLADVRDANECKPEDLLVFYFSGHGRNEDGKDYLLPIDARPRDVETLGIRVENLIRLLKGFGCANTILFIDACRELRGAKGTSAIGEDSSAIVSDAAMIAFFSCDPKEQSYEIDDLGHGSFTYCILQAIEEESAVSTVDDLNRYLKLQVPKINSKYKKGQQQPHSVVPSDRGKLKLLYRSYEYLKDKLLLLKQQRKISDADIISVVEFLDLIEDKSPLYQNDTTRLNFIKAFCEGRWSPKSFAQMWKGMWKGMEVRRLPAPESKKRSS